MVPLALDLNTLLVDRCHKRTRTAWRALPFVDGATFPQKASFKKEQDCQSAENERPLSQIEAKEIDAYNDQDRGEQ